MQRRGFLGVLRFTAVAAVAVVVMPWVRAEAQQASETPPILIGSLVGADLFAAYCAPCHGVAGRGDGPVGTALRVPPADLTGLARRNGGTYPPTLVEGRLTGTLGPRGSTAHGTTAMPIWGPIFQQLDQQDAVARVRIRNLVAFVGTLQVP